MKKLFFTFFVLANTSILFGEQNWTEKTVEFKELAKKHKMAWFDFQEKWTLKKIKLKKSHKADWFDFSIAMSKKLQNATDANKIAEQSQQNLMEALELRKKHMNNYDEYYTEFYKEGQEKHKEHLKEIAEFEESLGIKKDTTEEKNDYKEEDEDENDDDDREDSEDKD